MESFEEDGFVRPVRKADAHAEDGRDDWHRPSASACQEYAKKLCKVKSGVLFVQNCLKEF